jgi:beta-carotene 3-hydroxylase
MLSLIFIALATAGTMEFVAWFLHKYVMHGFLWDWHADHHKPVYEKNGFFEKNDRFFIFFAVLSMIFFGVGAKTPHTWCLAVGAGISIYGLIYFLIHDIYIHQRFNWFRHLDNPYSRAILRAHHSHHVKHTQHEGESFGLLVVARKYYKRKSDLKKA